MRILERNTREELRAAADSLEALLEVGPPDQEDMLALVSMMRNWGSEATVSPAACPPETAFITVH